MKVKRPIIRYHGGKWKLAPWIIEHFPLHRVYTEAFGGGASVLLQKERSYAEIYNDLDGEVVNLFKVARDQGEKLREALILTPFSRKEYLDAWYPSDDPVEQARRTVIRSFMGFGSAAITLMRLSNNPKRGGLARTGFRSNSNRSGTTPALDWMHYPDSFKLIIERLQGVVIENRDALEILKIHDGPETLHYVDPPYLPDTRDPGTDYRFEMNFEDHMKLAEVLHGLNGKIILSGYPNELYNDLYSEWKLVKKDSFADGARSRVECLWMRGIELGLFQ